MSQRPLGAIRPCIRIISRHTLRMYPQDPHPEDASSGQYHITPISLLHFCYLPEVASLKLSRIAATKFSPTLQYNRQVSWHLAVWFGCLFFGHLGRLEGTARYTGLLVAPAEGFGRGLFSGKKMSFLSCFCPF